MKNNFIKSVPTLCALACVVAAIGLLVAGFVVVPRGEIHTSVQIILGELLTFAGAVFGIRTPHTGRTNDEK